MRAGHASPRACARVPACKRDHACPRAALCPARPPAPRSYYFETAYDTSQALLGALLSWSSVVAGVAGLVSGYISTKLGLVITMVVTHLPSSLLLLAVPLVRGARVRAGW